VALAISPSAGSEYCSAARADRPACTASAPQGEAGMRWMA
jgi:hypothetical protein